VQVVDGVALVPAHRQTQAADGLAVLDAVHVEGLPRVLRAAGGGRGPLLLVLKRGEGGGDRGVSPNQQRRPDPHGRE
jgi:hypothetical protein